jgi:hypothetical protein
MLERVRKQFDMRQADFRQRTGDPLGSSLICRACRKRVGIDSLRHAQCPMVPLASAFCPMDRIAVAQMETLRRGRHWAVQ